MQYISDGQLFGFVLMILGIILGIWHWFSPDHDEVSKPYVASVLAILVGMLIVVVASFFSTPANHAGVGFY